MKVTDDFEIIEHNPHTASLEEKYQYKKTVHPHGTIPAMVTSEGTLMTESAAIWLKFMESFFQMKETNRRITSMFPYICF